MYVKVTDNSHNNRNSLPPTATKCATDSVFNLRLKTHLFNTAYS